VIPDQFVDRTAERKPTFFGRGLVAHVGFANRSAELRIAMSASLRRRRRHPPRGGAYVCIEGPQFSTRAESELYRSWGWTSSG
jgi:5'-methylthioadenosine phosphorylase